MSPRGARPRRRRAALSVASGAALAVSVGAALSSAPQRSAAAPAGARPNIVAIVTDDQTLASLSAATMPNTVTLFGARGTDFSNAIVTTPLCCPSRASLLTGQYAHNHGTLANSPGYAALRGKGNTLPVWLRRAGYVTAHVGKYLNRYEASVDEPAEVAPGWDEWHTVLGDVRYYGYRLAVNGDVERVGKRPRDYATRVINHAATRMVRRYVPRRRPLYLQVDHRAPHTEADANSGGPCGGLVPPDPRDEGAFAQEPLPRPPSFDEEDVTDKPSFVRDLPPLSDATAATIERRYRCALASLRSVDRGVGQLVAALREAKELDDTVLIVTSDNGFFFGEHRIPAKKTRPYEEGIRVPLLIRLPPSVLGGRSPVPQVDEQVANIDLAPTLLQLAGAQPCGGDGECRVMDGRSLLPLLLGQGGWPSDRGLVVEYAGASSRATSSCKYSGIRALGHLYVEHVQIPDPLTGICHESEEIEYYDMTRDPFQLQNLYPGYADPLMETLQERLTLLADCSGIAGRDPLPPAGSAYCE